MEGWLMSVETKPQPAPAKAEYRWAYTERPLSVSLTTPCVRMQVIHAWHHEGESRHLLYPVLAIRSVVRRRYGKRYLAAGDYPDDYGPEEELLQAGWGFYEQDVKDSLLILTDEFGLVAEDDPGLECSNSVSRAVCCPWPPSEDDTRLGRLVEELKREAAEKWERHQRKADGRN
jgi:hypothetical protein